jgi:hypothetical protein
MLAGESEEFGSTLNFKTKEIVLALNYSRNHLGEAK